MNYICNVGKRCQIGYNLQGKPWCEKIQGWTLEQNWIYNPHSRIRLKSKDSQNINMYNNLKIVTLPTNEEIKHKYRTITPPNEYACTKALPELPHKIISNILILIICEKLKADHLWETKSRWFYCVHDTPLMFRSRGLRAFWTISWTVLLRRQTSDSSSRELCRAMPFEPDAKSERALRKLMRSASVMTVDGINEMGPLAQSRTLGPYILAKDSRTYATCGK